MTKFAGKFKLGRHHTDPVAMPAVEGSESRNWQLRHGRLPIECRVGVTGHREITDCRAVTNEITIAVDSILTLLGNLLPHNVNIDLIAVSSLAEGADRLVAEEILKRGGQLEVVLPMPVADYLEDFKSSGSRMNFEGLLNEATIVRTVDGVDGVGNRDAGYLAAGRQVADRSDVMLAVWDGRAARGTGGTAEIVDYIRGRHQPLMILSPDEGEHIATDVGDGTAVLGGLTIDDLHRLDEFNRDRISDQSFQKALEEKKGMLEGKPEEGWDAPLDDLVGWMAPPFARADLVALKYQHLYQGTSVALFLFAASAVATVAAQIVFWPRQRFIVLFEILFLIVITAGLVWGRHGRIHERWISTRYLSERLRGAFYLALAGLDAEYRSTAMLPDEDPAAPWTRRAFSSVIARQPPAASRDRQFGRLQRFLAANWIEDQRTFFCKRAKHFRTRHDQFTHSALILFGLSVVVAGVHVALGGPESWVHNVVSFLSISVPAFAAAVGGLFAQGEFLRHALRYERMAKLLEIEHSHMLEAPDLQTVQRVATSVDRLMRGERGDWFGAVSVQDLEVPA